MSSLTRSSVILYVVASVALYCTATALLLPTLGFGPLPLDDQSLLTEFGGAPFEQVWSYDHFGHLRPGKNFTFWWLAHSPESLISFRALTLLTILLSAVLVQVLAVRHVMAPLWGLAAASAFLLHPATAIVQGWLAASNYVFALLFILGFVCVAELARCSTRPPLRRLLYAAAQLCLVVAVLFHELALITPLVLLVTPCAGSDAQPRRSTRLVPLLYGLLPCAIVLMLRASESAPQVAYRMADHSAGLLMFSSARYLLSNLGAWVWPSGSFALLYTDHPEVHMLTSGLAWCAVLALLVVATLLWRKAPSARFPMLWIGAFLLPLVNLWPIGNTPVALHYLYFPAVGLSLLVSMGLLQIGSLLARKMRLRAPIPHHGLLLVGVAVWLLESHDVVTASADAELLYARIIEHHSENVEARANLAAIYLERGNLDQADSLLEESLSIAPDDPAIVGNRFEVLWLQKRTTDALTFLEAHSTLNDADHFYRRGQLLESSGRWRESLPVYAEAAERAQDPDLRFTASFRRAVLLAEAGQYRDARIIVESMLPAFPDDEQLLLTHRLLVEREQSDD